jgi:hypothetical protein
MMSWGFIAHLQEIEPAKQADLIQKGPKQTASIRNWDSHWHTPKGLSPTERKEILWTNTSQILNASRTKNPGHRIKTYGQQQDPRTSTRCKWAQLNSHACSWSCRHPPRFSLASSHKPYHWLGSRNWTSRRKTAPNSVSTRDLNAITIKDRYLLRLGITNIASCLHLPLSKNTSTEHWVIWSTCTIWLFRRYWGAHAGYLSGAREPSTVSAVCQREQMRLRCQSSSLSRAGYYTQGRRREPDHVWRLF